MEDQFLSTRMRVGERRITFLLSSIQCIIDHDEDGCVICQGGIRTAIDLPYDEAIKKWREALE